MPHRMWPLRHPCQTFEFHSSRLLPWSHCRRQCPTVARPRSLGSTVDRRFPATQSFHKHRLRTPWLHFEVVGNALYVRTFVQRLLPNILFIRHAIQVGNWQSLVRNQRVSPQCKPEAQAEPLSFRAAPTNISVPTVDGARRVQAFQKGSLLPRPPEARTR
jgi:hypothetical protein